ncbi:hypothetical protein OV203_28670 [Nannocystis sp. ILAH1]|uniref:hypothetical protein n=1 Tax=unclassified Nannocystis TaxID=2627009 RepID=UPI00226EE18B|nr:MULTISPECIES: hypothetical protein [unclassified Nannocystis]MCY0991153.1 hypothetical protein [Nannocystis sp. ILAH1]MCY1064667.1 hypothetical protein [Nannocystis sp. RBIL2]
MPTIYSSTVLRTTTLAALLLAPACGEPDDSTTGTTEESETGGDPSGDPSGSPTGNPSGDTSGDTNDTNATSDSTPTTTGGEACYGDFSLGSVPFSGDPSLGQACDDPDVPKNCADGTYIKFADTGECICIAACSSGDKQVGEACIDGTNWVCQDVEATNAGMNGGKLCVNSEWNLCQKQ